MQMQATLRWVSGMQLVATAGTGHAIVLDTTADHGGTDTGTKPMELLLDAVAGCTAMDVVPLLRKMRVNFTGLEINVKAERSEEHPKVLTRIDLEYVVSGPAVDESAVKRAVDLSQEKYCSVSAMLRKSCPINYAVRVQP
jgi:putative redox protein